MYPCLHVHSSGPVHLAFSHVNWQTGTHLLWCRSYPGQQTLNTRVVSYGWKYGLRVILTQFRHFIRKFKNTFWTVRSFVTFLYSGQILFFNGFLNDLLHFTSTVTNSVYCSTSSLYFISLQDEIKINSKYDQFICNLKISLRDGFITDTLICCYENNQIYDRYYTKQKFTIIHPWNN